VIFSSLASEPENRYGDMGVFARDLEELAYILPVSLSHIGKQEDTVVDSVTKAKPCNLVNIPSSVLNPKSSKIVVLSILLLAVLGVLAFVIGHITNAPNGLPTSQAVALSMDTIQLPAVASQVSPRDGMELVQIPAGEFLMGANNTDSDEKPQHKVRLDVYWIDKLEVTNGQYAQCVLDGKCEEPKDKTSNTRKVYFGNPAYDNFPVIHVNWSQAQVYCAWAGRRLPTEAEWEKGVAKMVE